MTLTERLFAIEARKSSVFRELIAGFTTFLSMVYALAIVPLTLSQAGMDFGAVLFATAMAAAIGTLIVALLSNYPFAVAPGLGLNAYLAYGIVLQEGYTWQQALGACFLTGCAFYLLNILGIREMIINYIPKNLRLATIAGVGILLALIGLKQSGLIVAHPKTLLALGNIKEGRSLLFLFGLLLTSVLLVLKNKFAFLIGILVNWFLGFCLGYVEWMGWVSLPPNPAPTFLALEFSAFASPAFLPIVLSLLFAALFDATGVLGLAKQGEYLTPQGRLPRVKQVFFGDTFGTLVGSLLGTSPATLYLESSSGMTAGGRTGLTGIVIAFLFLLSLFFTPLILSIPLFATTPVLVLIGVLMTQQLDEMQWHDFSEWIPAFLTLIGIPLTWSIADGMALGFVAYPLLKLFSRRGKEVSTLSWMLGFVFAIKLFF